MPTGREHIDFAAVAALAAQARFLAERGATKLPSSREMAAIDPVNVLKWDRGKKKWTRASVPIANRGPHWGNGPG